jgi:hypothetical protein
MTQSIYVKFLRYIILTVGILKGQIELVVSVQKIKTALVGSRTFFGPAFSVNVHVDEGG